MTIPVPDIIRAPWTSEQVAILNAFQTEAYIHPFTCGNCRPRPTLIATTDGWRCAACDYQQDWAPDYMTDPVVLDALQPPWANYVGKKLSET